jgi:T5SS/PEP-CTERM-associated repeat protein
MKRCNRIVVYLALSCAMAVFSKTADAQTNAVTSSNWTDPNTWSAGVPNDATPALIDGGRTVTINSSGPITNNIDIGNASGESGTLNLTGGDLAVTDPDTTTPPNLPSIRLGVVAGSTGNMNVSGGATVFIDGPTPSDFAIGELLVGDNGDGNLTITDGTVQAADEIFIGFNPTSTGTVDISGGTLQAVGRSILVGFGGNGILNVSGTANVDPNFDLLVGFLEGSSATINQSGGTIDANFMFSNSFTGGTGSTVNINMTGGTFNANIAYVLGQGNGTTTMNHSGGTINSLAGNGDMVVADGDGNTSVYNISGTAQVNLLHNFIVGVFDGPEGPANGTINQTGGAVSAGDNLAIGRDGIGTWNISSGTVTATNVFLGDFDSSSGTMRISGGDVIISGTFSVGGALASNAAPDRVEPDGNNGAQGQALDANGTLVVSGSTATIDVGGNFKANPDDKSSFRSDPFIVGGDNSATLGFEIFNSSGTSLINVAGIADLDGAVIDLDLMGGFSPAVNATFDLLRAASFGSTGSGTTENVGTGEGFSLATEDAGAFSLAVVASGGFEILRATFLGSATSPGDFDNDGDVDGRDFLVWQRGGSPNPLSSGDLTLWQSNYGTGSLAAVGSVPEPASAALIGVLGVLACTMRVRSRAA